MTRAALARRPPSQDFNNTPLHYACRYCNLSICKMLRRAGAEVNQINELGITPLGFAAMFNQPEPRQGAYIKMIKWLIREGAKVNVVDKGGHTPLEIAASWGNMKLVSFLLQKDGRVRREVEYLSIKAPSPVDVAATDEVKHLLKTKLRKEQADFAAVAATSWLLVGVGVGGGVWASPAPCKARHASSTSARRRAPRSTRNTRASAPACAAEKASPLLPLLASPSAPAAWAARHVCHG